MAKRKHTAEQIIGKLREAEVLLAQGQTVAQVSRALGLTEQSYDELLKIEIFYTLQEAQVLIERWRRDYNSNRPHSALDYRPPAPVTLVPGTADPACAMEGLRPDRPFPTTPAGLT